MLLDDIKIDLIKAMKARDQARVDTLRFLLSAINKYEVDAYPPSKGGSLTQADVEKILQKQVKNHLESIEAFKKAGRHDLIQKETNELKILEVYLPPQLTDSQIKEIVDKLKPTAANFGELMGKVMKEIAGQADGGRVAQIIRQSEKG